VLFSETVTLDNKRGAAMSKTLRRLGVLVLAAMLLAAAAGNGQAQGNRRITFGGVSVVANPVVQPQLRLGQVAYNMAFLGSVERRLPPYLFGYNPYAGNPFLGTGLPSTPGLAGSPYSISTLGGLGGGYPSLSTSPYGAGGDYSLSTTPGAGGYNPSGYYPPYSYIPPTAAALMGAAALTNAEGQYWNQIEQARLLREQSYQASFDTAKKLVEFQRWYENMRPTAPKMREAEMATNLEIARKDASNTDIWSGRALNTLLGSIQLMGSLNRGPNLSLEEDILKHINLSAGGRGNIGMLRNDGNLNWPLSLQEAQFTDQRDRLAKNLRRAVADLKGKDPVELALLKDINNDFKALNEKLSTSADEMSPGQYIEAKRYLNQLAQAIKALSDPKAVNYFNNTWNAKGKNVAELVNNMTKEGLVFAPAAPGDEAAYSSLYQSLRAFEAGMSQSQK
jgi:hypothetical protein